MKRLNSLKSFIILLIVIFVGGFLLNTVQKTTYNFFNKEENLKISELHQTQEGYETEIDFKKDYNSREYRNNDFSIKNKSSEYKKIIFENKDIEINKEKQDIRLVSIISLISGIVLIALVFYSINKYLL